MFYKALLAHQRTFQFNRFYLIGAALFSLLVPLMHINISPTAPDAGSSLAYAWAPIMTEIYHFQGKVVHQIDQPTALVISIGDIIRIIYWIGVIVMAVRLLDALLRIWTMISSGHKRRDREATIVYAAADVPAASFFSYIFWSKAQKSDDVEKAILEHELVHVRQWHSMDVILMEMMVVAKWFNPLIYLYRRSLRLVHEYIADDYVASKIGSRVTYANVLLSHSSHDANVPPLTTGFYSQVRERLHMLTRPSSGRWSQRIRGLLVIPVMIGLAALFAFDLSDEIPAISSSIDVIESKIDAVTMQTAFQFDKSLDQDHDSWSLDWGPIKRRHGFHEGDVRFSRTVLVEELSLFATTPIVATDGDDLTLSDITVDHYRGDRKIDSYSIGNFVQYAETKDDSLSVDDRFIATGSVHHGDDVINVKVYINLYRPITDRAVPFFKWGEVLMQSLERYETSISKQVSYLSKADLVAMFKDQPTLIGYDDAYKNWSFDMRVTSDLKGVYKYHFDNSAAYVAPDFIQASNSGTVCIEDLHIETNNSSMTTSFCFDYGPNDTELVDVQRTYRFDPTVKKSLMEQGKITIDGKYYPMYSTFGLKDRATNIITHTPKDLQRTLRQFDPKLEVLGKRVDLDDAKVELILKRFGHMDVEDAKRYMHEFTTGQYVLDIDGAIVMLEHNGWGNRQSIKQSVTTTIDDLKDDDRILKWLSTVDNGDRLQIVLTQQDGDRSEVEFLVRTEDAAYTPEILIRQKYTSAIEPSAYQMITLADGSRVVRADASTAEGRSVIDAFATSQATQVVDVKDFTTYYRILDYRDPLASIPVKDVMLSEGVRQIDPLVLQDYPYNKDFPSELRWGRIVAKKDIGNYSLAEFRRSARKGVGIQVAADERHNVARFDIYLYEKGQEAVGFRVSDPRDLRLVRAIDGLEGPVTIHLDNVIVEEDGDYYNMVHRYEFVVE
jgi:beta-lactamase regulating signal transducer with metallopeptidase domain